jgi:hypothetical protein
MTSVALAKILFAKWPGGARDYKPMAPDLDAMLSATARSIWQRSG